MGLVLVLRTRLRGVSLRRRPILLPVAELVFIVPGLGRASFLHRRRRLGLRMRPALREAIVVVLVHSALWRTRNHGRWRMRRFDRPWGSLRLLRARIGTRHVST